MKKEAIYHINESEYSYPISTHALKIRIRVAKDDDISKIEVHWNISFKMYNTQKINVMEMICSDELFSYYETIIEDEIPAYSYVFKIYLLNGEFYYYSENGFAKEYDFSMSHLDSFRMGFINKNDIIYENETFKGDVFYQIFPERFLSFDPNIDKSFVNRPWDTTDLRSKMGDVIQDIYIGGDLKGIINKLEYLKDLGIDDIYMTPIYKSNTNHKYDVVDYYEIDRRLGTDQDLLDLVNKAHELGMKIVLDLVFNHSAYNNEMFLDVVKNGKKSKYYDFYWVNGDKPTIKPLNYYCFAAVFGMPKLNSNNYQEQDYFVEVGKYFIEKYHIDGYRLDVANEVSHDFWINFKRELLKIKPDIILIGECWYNSHSYLRANEFESVMNYPFLNQTADFYISKKIDAKMYADKLNGLLMRYQENSNKMMLNLLDCHDTERFFNRLESKDVYLLAVVTLIMHVGWPLLYYGNEIFMKGGGDPFNRKGMEWESAEFNSKYHQLFKDIIHLRKNKVVREGQMKIYALDELFVIERFLANKKMTLLINNTDRQIKYPLKKKIILSNNYLDELLLPYSFVVYLD